MNTRQVLAAAIAGVIAAFTVPAGAQVVRETDVNTIAGVLVSPDQPAKWTFRSAGGETLFASLDADLYRVMAAHEGEDGEDHGGGGSGGGCGSGEDEGGPGKFYIEVQDVSDNMLCRAVRPAPPPGWQRDPRLACTLPATGGVQLTYKLVVGLNATHEESAALASEGMEYPFLLNVSLRRHAPVGTAIQAAVAQSNNRL